jgi:hypothetical protein
MSVGIRRKVGQAWTRKGGLVNEAPPKAAYLVGWHSSGSHGGGGCAGLGGRGVRGVGLRAREAHPEGRLSISRAASLVTCRHSPPLVTSLEVCKIEASSGRDRTWLAGGTTAVIVKVSTHDSPEWLVTASRSTYLSGPSSNPDST